MNRLRIIQTLAPFNRAQVFTESCWCKDLKEEAEVGIN